MPVLFTVPQSHCVIIERFGKFNRVASQGLRFAIPLIDSIRHVPEWGRSANKLGCQIELTEQQTDTPSRQCHTSDNVSVMANASVYWRIVDPVRALYEVDVLPKSVEDIALNALRANIGKLELDSLLGERERLNELIASQLSKTADKWGIRFTRVEIQELQTTDDTATAMRQQMEAERQRRATVSHAQGEAERKIRVAEADKRAMILRAEGEAQALEMIASAELKYLQQLGSAIDSQSAGRILIAQKMLESLERISANPAHKVFLPNDLRSMILTESGFDSAPGPSVEMKPSRPVAKPSA